VLFRREKYCHTFWLCGYLKGIAQYEAYNCLLKDLTLGIRHEITFVWSCQYLTNYSPKWKKCCLLHPDEHQLRHRSRSQNCRDGKMLRGGKN